MKTLLKVSDILSWVCKWAARFAGALLLILTALIMYDVIGRKFFNTGSLKLQELEWHLHGAIAMLCFGYAYTRNAHVRIDIFAGKMSERAKLWLEFWGILLLLIPGMLILAWYGYTFAERSFTRNEVAPGGLGLSHRWIVKSLVPVSAILTIFGGVSVAIRCLATLRGVRETPFESRGLWTR